MSKIQPRQTATRSERAMALALFYASFSKDPNTQMGAVLVNNDNELISAGYNGPPKQMNDDVLNWGREPDEFGLTKYLVISHAEINLLRFSKGKAKNCTMYVTGFPCQNCMLEIVANGVKKVVFYPHKSNDNKSMFNNAEIFAKSRKIAELGGVELEEFNGNLRWAKDWVANWPDYAKHPSPLHDPNDCKSIMYMDVGDTFVEMWSGELYRVVNKDNLSEIKILRLRDEVACSSSSAMQGKLTYVHQPAISPLLDPLSGQ